MAETQETHENSADETPSALSTHGETVSFRLERIEKALREVLAQTRSNGERLTATERAVAFRADAHDQQLGFVLGRLDTQRDAVVQIHHAVIHTTEDADPVPGTVVAMLREIHMLVQEAAPLLQSRAAKALRAGGSVIDYIKAGRRGE